MTVAATDLPSRYRTHAARLYPTASQAEALNEQGHTARALWNLIHEWCTWGGSGHSGAGRPTAAEMDRQLRDARTDPLPDWEWLATLPAQATQQVLKHYLRAWKRFFDGLAGPPRFKKRSSHMAVDVPQASGLRIVRLNRRWGRVMIPRIGPVRFRWTRPYPESLVAVPAGLLVPAWSGIRSAGASASASKSRPSRSRPILAHQSGSIVA